MKDVGRIGLRALIYFEVVSTVALVIGLVVVTFLKPGIGVGFDPATADVSSVKEYTTASSHLSTVDFLLNVIPDTVVGAFARGEVLQVLLFAVLFGLALLRLGPRVETLVSVIASASDALFNIVGIIMRLAPVGAFGVKFLRYIGEEILIVLGTSSSESALPRLMAKLEYLGCAKPVVGLVVPTGYSFNLDGTSIYMTMAAIFVAQASGVQLTWGQELGILGVLLLTSKGAAAVTGSGFITLAATLAAFPTIPVAGLTLLLGVDRFMSEARAITNLIGNAVATMVVAKWDNALDLQRARLILDGGVPSETVVVEETITLLVSN
jgi:aerobic C4-dicarboxylate transport protein